MNLGQQREDSGGGRSGSTLSECSDRIDELLESLSEDGELTSKEAHALVEQTALHIASVAIASSNASRDSIANQLHAVAQSFEENSE